MIKSAQYESGRGHHHMGTEIAAAALPARYDVTIPGEMQN